MNRFGWVLRFLLLGLLACGKDARPTAKLAVAQAPVVEHKEAEPIEAPTTEAQRERMKEALNALYESNGARKKDTLGLYASKVAAELLRDWEVPATLTPTEAQSLADSVEVLVRLSESGNIDSFQFRKKSGDVAFDDSIEHLLKRFQVQSGGKTLPLPDDPSTRSAVIQHGINLKGWHYIGE